MDHGNRSVQQGSPVRSAKTSKSEAPSDFPPAVGTAVGAHDFRRQEEFVAILVAPEADQNLARLQFGTGQEN
jgi:hypothetical protein